MDLVQLQILNACNVWQIIQLAQKKQTPQKMQQYLDRKNYDQIRKALNPKGGIMNFLRTILCDRSMRIAIALETQLLSESTTIPTTTNITATASADSDGIAFHSEAKSNITMTKTVNGATAVNKMNRSGIINYYNSEEGRHFRSCCPRSVKHLTQMYTVPSTKSGCFMVVYVG